MKKVFIFIALLFSYLTINAQVAKIIIAVNDAADVASFDLDCTRGFPVLAKGLKYNITRHEFRGPEMKNTYHLMLVMDGYYTTVLNHIMTVTAVFSDGTTYTKIETIEDDGYFDGACTIKMNSPPESALTKVLKQIIVHTDKDVVYDISADKAFEFRKNIENIVKAK